MGTYFMGFGLVLTFGGGLFTWASLSMADVPRSFRLGSAVAFLLGCGLMFFGGSRQIDENRQDIETWVQTNHCTQVTTLHGDSEQIYPTNTSKDLYVVGLYHNTTAWLCPDNIVHIR